MSQAVEPVLVNIAPHIKHEGEQPNVLQEAVEEGAQSIYNTERLDSLMNIDTAFKQTRLVTVAALVMSLLFCVAVMVVAMHMVTKGKGKIYITNGYGNTLSGYQIAANQNRRAEVKAQVRNFHTLLYDISPNPEEIKKNLDAVMLIGDASVKAFLDKRGDQYYKKLISSNVEIKYSMDSIKVDMYSYPYRAMQYGKETVQTPAGSLLKKLVTKLDLREVKRTEINPHGLLVGNFEILKNGRIEYIESE